MSMNETAFYIDSIAQKLLAVNYALNLLIADGEIEHDGMANRFPAEFALLETLKLELSTTQGYVTELQKVLEREGKQ